MILTNSEGQPMEMRELKGLEIAARSKISREGDIWLVPSQSSGATYRVNIWASPSCTCEDFQLNCIGTGRVCKHIVASRAVAEREGIRQSEVIVDSVPKKKSYAQNWPLYTKAQQTEKHRFQALLFELCRGIEEEPQTGPGTRRAPMADRAFAACLKVYTTFSSRRFACDLQDAFDKGHLSKMINSVVVCSFLENENMTPILQQLIVQSSLPLRAVETVFAPDSTGFATSRFVKWFDIKYNEERECRQWVKAHAICGVRTN